MAGVSVLYLADSPETAIAEVKPDVEELITVGVFKLVSKAKTKIIDLTNIRSPEDPVEKFRKQLNGDFLRDYFALQDLSVLICIKWRR